MDSFKPLRIRHIQSAALLTAIPIAVLCGVLLLTDRAPPSPAPGQTTRVDGVTPPGGVAPVSSFLRPLPAKLAATRIATGEVSAAQLEAVATNEARPAGERLLALRRLGRTDPQAAIVRAERVVRAAKNDSASRQLAVNALGVLARTQGGQPVLKRLVREAPSRDLRRAARLLLAHR